jgi:hypothetical protein
MKNILFITILISQLSIGLTLAQIENYSNFIVESDSIRIVKITLIDSTFSIGTIVNKSDTSILFKSLSDLVFSIRTDRIKEISYINSDSLVIIPSSNNPGISRLFFSPTARTLKAGSGYFSLHEVFFPFISIAAADIIELGGGISIYPEGDKQYYFLSSKFQLYCSENISASAGLIYLGISKEPDETLLGYGIVTLGNEKMGVTLGYGSNLMPNKKNDLSGLFIVGGDIQISDFIKLISENYLLLEEEGATVVYSSGVRFFGENLALDIGFFGAIDSSKGWPFLPWISFSYNF